MTGRRRAHRARGHARALSGALWDGLRRPEVTAAPPRRRRADDSTLRGRAGEAQADAPGPSSPFLSLCLGRPTTSLCPSLSLSLPRSRIPLRRCLSQSQSFSVSACAHPARRRGPRACALRTDRTGIRVSPSLYYAADGTRPAGGVGPRAPLSAAPAALRAAPRAAAWIAARACRPPTRPASRLTQRRRSSLLCAAAPLATRSASSTSGDSAGEGRGSPPPLVRRPHAGEEGRLLPDAGEGRLLRVPWPDSGPCGDPPHRPAGGAAQPRPSAGHRPRSAHTHSRAGPGPARAGRSGVQGGGGGGGGDIREFDKRRSAWLLMGWPGEINRNHPPRPAPPSLRKGFAL